MLFLYCGFEKSEFLIKFYSILRALYKWSYVLLSEGQID